jgi:hypothetical protein
MLSELDKKSEAYKEDFSMVMRHINLSKNVQEMRGAHRVRLQHFENIASQKYLSSNGILPSDFTTYQFEKP